MSKIVNLFVICLFFAPATSVFSKSQKDQDAFDRCMASTRHERSTCTQGCGLILQQCYDRGVEDLDRKVDSLIAEAKSRSEDVCANFSLSYAARASRMDAEIITEAEALPGWVASELRLNLARQRFYNLTLIQESCHS